MYLLHLLHPLTEVANTDPCFDTKGRWGPCVICGPARNLHSDNVLLCLQFMSVTTKTMN